MFSFFSQRQMKPYKPHWTQRCYPRENCTNWKLHKFPDFCVSLVCLFNLAPLFILLWSSPIKALYSGNWFSTQPVCLPQCLSLTHKPTSAQTHTLYTYRLLYYVHSISPAEPLPPLTLPICVPLTGQSPTVPGEQSAE